MLTIEQCEKHALHALGDPESLHPALSGLRLVNMAGHALENANEWRFMERVGSVATVAAQDYVVLPTLRAIYHVQYVAGTGSWLRETHYQNILELRGGSTVTASRPSYYAVIPNTDSTSGAVTNRLELYPTPNAAASVTLYYNGGFQEPGDNGRIAVPVWCEELFLLFVRSCAQGFQEHDNAALEKRRESILQSSTFRDAVRRDRQLQTNFGAITGGGVALQQGYTTRSPNFSAPSI